MDIKEIDITGIFEKGGILAGEMPRYEFRKSQLEMAHAVEAALDNKNHLMVEADTGVGKSMAYLAPSILWALKNEKKVIISTNTINLQEQLVYKDLPVLHKIIPSPFNAVLVKGRHNYICLRRFQRILDDKEHSVLASAPDSGDKGLDDWLTYLEKWLKKTKDGSAADMTEQPPHHVWDEISCEQDNCLGKKCAFHEACFFQKARARIYKADVLIVNHHLFFSDLALKKAGGNFLPKYDAVILDEAHFVEEISTEHLGFEISNLAVKYLLNKLFNPKTGRGILVFLQESKAIEITTDLHRLNDVFFDVLEEKLKKKDDGIIRIKKPKEVPDVLGPGLMQLRKELKQIKERMKENSDMNQELTAYLRRVSDLCEGLDTFRNQTLLGHVYWMEMEFRHSTETGVKGKKDGDRGRYRRIVLQAYPIAVNAHLKALLFDGIKTVILTGATLSVNNSFDYFKARLGADGIEGLKLGSSFNYKDQMKIYVPKDIPQPKEASKYKEALVPMINKYLDYTGGKAFVLFTSYKLMRDVYEQVAPALFDKGINSFIQGGGTPRHVMLQKFREDVNSVLFGTDSFWTGVDVEGEALSSVIITKLPFAVPDHPLMRARLDYIEEQGKNAFVEYSLPQAVIKLRQGVGRLIRSRTDKGIIVILDNRIINSHYGKIFWDSLPECPRIIE